MTIRIPKAVVLVLVVLIVGGGSALAGYYVGRDSIDRKAIADTAYHNGRQAGLARGRDQGFSEATKFNTRDIAQASKNTADAVLGGIEPKDDRYYIVRFKRATGIGLPWIIDESYGVADQTSYSLCTDKASICERPE